VPRARNADRRTEIGRFDKQVGAADRAGRCRVIERGSAVNVTKGTMGRPASRASRFPMSLSIAAADPITDDPT
jgi:hypothetical protein